MSRKSTVSKRDPSPARPSGWSFRRMASFKGRKNSGNEERPPQADAVPRAATMPEVARCVLPLSRKRALSFALTAW